MSRGKKYIESRKKQPNKKQPMSKAIEAVKKLDYSGFDGSVELSLKMKLGKDVDAKSVKGSVTLPHTSDTSDTKIAVFASSDKQKEAKEAGADFTNLEELIESVKAGNIEFDVAIATPEVMGQIAVLGKELGPRGLMPNPKTGTVTEDIASTVAAYKKGKKTFACSTSGVINMSVGKLSMTDEQIKENIMEAIDATSHAVNKKPGQAILAAHLAPTMGPSVEVSLELEEEA